MVHDHGALMQAPEPSTSQRVDFPSLPTTSSKLDCPASSARRAARSQREKVCRFQATIDAIKTKKHLLDDSSFMKHLTRSANEVLKIHGSLSDSLELLSDGNSLNNEDGFELLRWAQVFIQVYIVMAYTGIHP